MSAPPSAGAEPPDTPALVHLIDDDAAVRAGLGLLLRSAGYSVAAHETGSAFLRDIDPGACPARCCVLTDVRMPGIDGIALVARLRESQPRLAVVVMTGHGDVATAVRAMKAGARDFLEKPFDDDTLLQAIATAIEAGSGVATAGSQFSDAARRIALLTRREREVLDLLAAGRANKVVAHELGLSERTVEVHRARMLERLGVRSLSEAVRLAVLAELAAGQST